MQNKQTENSRKSKAISSAFNSTEKMLMLCCYVDNKQATKLHKNKIIIKENSSKNKKKNIYIK